MLCVCFFFLCFHTRDGFMCSYRGSEGHTAYTHTYILRETHTHTVRTITSSILHFTHFRHVKNMKWRLGVILYCCERLVGSMRIVHHHNTPLWLHGLTSGGHGHHLGLWLAAKKRRSRRGRDKWNAKLFKLYRHAWTHCVLKAQDPTQKKKMKGLNF